MSDIKVEPVFSLWAFDARSLPDDFPFRYARVRGDGQIEGSHDRTNWQATTFKALTIPLDGVAPDDLKLHMDESRAREMLDQARASLEALGANWKLARCSLHLDDKRDFAQVLHVRCLDPFNPTHHYEWRDFVDRGA